MLNLIMDMNGLDISEKEFMRMDSKARDVIIFKNLTCIRQKMEDYSFHKKVQYVWLTILTSITLVVLGIKQYVSG
jgi:hypothetical protein